MPRIARAVAQGFPHHIIQRGNNKADLFFDKEDRRQYLRLVKKYSEKWPAAMLAYCLMTNHCHMLIRPSSESALFKMMQGVTRQKERSHTSWIIDSADSRSSQKFSPAS